MIFVQTKAPAGNFTDYMGTHDLEAARGTREYLIRKGEIVQIVQRVDMVIINEEGKKSRI